MSLLAKDSNYRRHLAYFVVVQSSLSLILLWIGSTPWRTTLTEVITEDLGTTIVETGSDVVPLVSVNAVVSLAAVLGVIATRTWGRRVIGTLAALVALISFVSILTVQTEGLVGWLITSGALSLGLVVTNSLAAVRGARWPSLGRKYERQGIQETTDPWSALDRGIDPTLD